jgi:hypothetical protein
MTPVELLARLAALVPPPRYPLVRYHGVLAPHSKWRGAVVPKAPPVAHAHNPLTQSHRRNRKDQPATAPAVGTSPVILPRQRGHTHYAEILCDCNKFNSNSIGLT